MLVGHEETRLSLARSRGKARAEALRARRSARQAHRARERDRAQARAGEQADRGTEVGTDADARTRSKEARGAQAAARRVYQSEEAQGERRGDGIASCDDHPPSRAGRPAPMSTLRRRDQAYRY